MRFLNAVGGGTVTGFQSGGVVLVCDDSGFDIPVLASEVVVVDTDDYNFQRAAKPAPKAPEPEEEEEVEKPVTFKPKPLERRGGELPAACLAFLPSEVMDDAFEVYFVNDCNYYLRYQLLSLENAACTLLASDEVEPNTKQFLADIPRTELGRWERVAVQALASKRDKPFRPVPAIDTTLRIDGSRFFKPGAFRANDFFDEGALIVDIVRP